MLTEAELEYAAGTVQRSVKPEYGHLFFSAIDCQTRSAANTRVQSETVTADTFTYYTDSKGTPSLTQDRTSTSGNGGYLNLPVGTLKVTLTLDAGRRVGTYDVVIRAGAITYLLFGPTP